MDQAHILSKRRPFTVQLLLVNKRAWNGLGSGGLRSSSPFTTTGEGLQKRSGVKGGRDLLLRITFGLSTDPGTEALWFPRSGSGV